MKRRGSKDAASAPQRGERCDAYWFMPTRVPGAIVMRRRPEGVFMLIGVGTRGVFMKSGAGEARRRVSCMRARVRGRCG